MALNKLQGLICYKTQPANQSDPYGKRVFKATFIYEKWSTGSKQKPEKMTKKAKIGENE